MESTQQKLFILRHNKIQDYDWGSSSPNCLIAQLRREEHKKYAQLWMGTHPKGPSKINEDLTLSEYLLKQNISPELPFLFKLLNIQKALSIQIHPNKKQAEKLHSQNPIIYQDNNEKPEMFLTLTDFECLFGIINKNDLQKLFTIEPFKGLKTNKESNIKEIIVELLSFNKEERQERVLEVLKNYGSICPERTEMINKLQQQFPFDEGILVSCLLKYKTISAGNCFAIEAGVPHAYLKGSCLQIMKNSDNVIRLGLTPKLKDVKTLLAIMKDQLDLDGIAVDRKEEKGYEWNSLVIRPLVISGNKIQFINNCRSIGIVLKGEVSSSMSQFKATKGDVFYIQKGNYLLNGDSQIYLGGYLEL